MEGTDITERGRVGLKEKAELLACPTAFCKFRSSRLLIENVTLSGKIYTAASVVYSTNLVLEMTNCTFIMNQVSEGGLLDYSSSYIHYYIKMMHVTANVASLQKATNIFSIARPKESEEIDDVLILCPQSLHPVEIRKYKTSIYQCAYSCSKDFYTLDAGSMTINKNHSLENSSVEKPKGHCFPCPVGAYCENQIKALPNYWGYRIKSTNDITMIRCPDQYCCSGNITCKTITSCNTGRTGTLCGNCENNLEESLFSAKCIPKENCYSHLIFILYFALVLIYGINIIFFIFLKDNVHHIGKYFWVLIKEFWTLLKRRMLQRRCDRGIEIHPITNRRVSALAIQTRDVDLDLENNKELAPELITIAKDNIKQDITDSIHTDQETSNENDKKIELQNSDDGKEIRYKA